MAEVCNCIDEVDAKLAEHNATVVTTLGLFNNPRRVSLEVEKSDAKKRGKPPRLIATFCPFCGTRYASSAAAQSAGAEG